jgi:dipeptidyl aminopeptidase/acylaminoacyl peptidase
VVNPYGGPAWGTGDWGDGLCGRVHDWSPDGQQVAFIRDGQLWLSDADGGRQLPRPSLADVLDLREPRFAPDGSRIAVVAARTSGTASILYDVWIIGTSDDARQRLFEETAGGYPV